MPSTNTILFITNREHGAANVHLAVLYELAQDTIRRPFLHIATFAPLKKHVLSISEQASNVITNKTNTKISYHELPGPYLTQSIARQAGESFSKIVIHGPAIRGALQGYRFLPKFAAGWTVQEHLGLYSKIASLIEEIDPTVIVLDPAFQPAVEAVRDSKRRYVVLSPNTLKDGVGSLQPNLAGFWKYPMFATGLPFPLPLYLIPLNLFFLGYLICCILTSKKLKAKNNGLKNARHIAASAIYDAATNPTASWLVPSIPESDLPVTFVPDNVVCCGPIIMDFGIVRDQDAELDTWLNKRSTVLINLGSLFDWDDESAIAMAGALRVFLEAAKDIQILWKAKLPQDSTANQLLDTHIRNDKIRIIDWLASQPGTILRHENIVASVHHGGASSYHEAVSAGKPQVILAMWYDLYDFAVRAEFLGIGIWGNRRMAPRWGLEELSAALFRVVGDEDMREKARKLAEVCRSRGSGRKNATEKIVEAL